MICFFIGKPDSRSVYGLIELIIIPPAINVFGKNTNEFGTHKMSRKTRRIALMLDLEWPYKRHTSVFAGTQRYAEELGWESIVDEYAYDRLPSRRTKSLPYDGIVARATRKLADRAAHVKVPVVNVWRSSPVQKILPSVFPDYQTAGRLRAEHLLS